MPPYTSLAKRTSKIADEWATGKFDGRANAHPGPPLATPLVSKYCNTASHSTIDSHAAGMYNSD